MAGERKWVTMGDVAARAGVGKITVSRALRDPSKVTPATLEKIQVAVAELGYVRDETAGALSSQRSRIVGALVSTLEQPVFASTIRGLTEGLAEGGVQLLLGATQYDPQTEAALISAMLGRRPDALVLTSSEHSPEARRLLERSGVPVIELWELPDRPVHHAVGFSNREAGAAVTRHLIASGRRRIAFLATDRPADTRARLREDGYQAALAGRALPRLLRIPVDAAMSGTDYGAAGLRAVLERWPDTDAVVCVSDALALGAVSEVRRRGIAVPGALAITGFGDVDFAGESGLNLTTVRIDGEAIGRRAAALVLEGADAPQRIDMGFEVVRRGTG
ncbi:LacI family DNA-binding transcriptional regulator [Tropicibacter sp. S64]|uniref:LacI family DNA-binding transcriptional regulator n=1 Tax=Tropicibacter sp. S64 TaxID=3415122 RepID=UPI003C7C1ECA